MAAAGDKPGQGSMPEILAVLCTCPDEAAAARLAEGLVGQRLAACVNILPGIRSIYRWQGETQNDVEVLMIAKTTRSAYARLEAWLLDHHPYDVPEILALPVPRGSATYLGWVAEETGT
jgi:periplasmic divalent cation tolerance protein